LDFGHGAIMDEKIWSVWEGAMDEIKLDFVGRLRVNETIVDYCRRVAMDYKN